MNTSSLGAGSRLDLFDLQKNNMQKFFRTDVGSKWYENDNLILLNADAYSRPLCVGALVANSQQIDRQGRGYVKNKY